MKANNKELPQSLPKIKVLGIGGAGGNIISRMNRAQFKGVEFVAINTDLQDLLKTGIRNKIHIGRNISRGLGTGMNPELGRQAAEESRPLIEETLRGADMVFLSCGLGGGTGTGATPVIAELCQELGILTVAVVTKPFSFEGRRRAQIAEEGLAKLREKVDAYIVIPNDRIFTIIDQETPLYQAFEMIDEILKQAVKGIADLIAVPGIINVDFADVKAVLEGAGMTIIGLGRASGEKRALEAAKKAIDSPLFEVSPQGAKGVLFNVIGGPDLKMSEINEAARFITEVVDPSAKIIFGASEDSKLRKGEIKIMVVAAGFEGTSKGESLPTLFTNFSSETSEAKKSSPQIPPVSEQNNLEIPAFLRRKKK